jgi:hypothetical protein
VCPRRSRRAGRPCGLTHATPVKLLAAPLLLLMPLVELTQGAREETIATFVVSPAVATEDGAPVVDDAWVADQLAFAETMFGDLGVHFGATAVRPLDARFAHMESRADRDALATQLEPRVINVFFVASLRDVDEPDRLRMGVHWRQRGHDDRHYVIVAASARPSVLAHELGHFFGNGHSTVQNNLMSYDRSFGPVFFDDAQIRRIRAFAKEYVRTGELDHTRL